MFASAAVTAIAAPSGAALPSPSQRSAAAEPQQVPASAHYVEFVSGGRLRVIGWRFLLEDERLNLDLPDGNMLDVPIASLARILDGSGKPVIALGGDGFASGEFDVTEPVDAAQWVPHEGFSHREVWDSWEEDPKWAYRWTDRQVAWAWVQVPRGVHHVMELRLLPIAYAYRKLAGEKPSSQRLKVTLASSIEVELTLDDTDWSVYRIPLTSTIESGPHALRLETPVRRPIDFSNGRNEDRRTLGVALDWVRFSSSASERRR